MNTINVERDIIAQASVSIKGTVDEVWDALMNPDAIRKYMFGATVESSWKEGDPIIWKGQWQGKKFEDKGTVLQVEPKQILQYNHYSPLSGKEDVPANYHTVTIALAQEDSTVWVALTQDKNSSEKERQHSEKNWNAMLLGLKEYIEQS